MRTPLTLYTLYQRPPASRVVVLRWTVTRAPDGTAVPTRDRDPHAVVDSLDAARRAVPPGLVCLARDPQDDPALVETWL